MSLASDEHPPTLQEREGFDDPAYVLIGGACILKHVFLHPLLAFVVWVPTGVWLSPNELATWVRKLLELTH